jgi:hypothetical protein
VKEEGEGEEQMTSSRREIQFGKAVAQIWLDNEENAILLSNNIGMHIAKIMIYSRLMK